MMQGDCQSGVGDRVDMNTIHAVDGSDFLHACANRDDQAKAGVDASKKAAQAVLPAIELTGDKKKEEKHRSLFDTIGHEGNLLAEGLVSGIALNPINGLTQLSNNVLGTHFGKLQFANQKEVDNSIAGKVGEFAGGAIDFIAISALTGGAADVAMGAGAAADATGLAAAGAIQNGLLTPTETTDKGASFVVDRLESAMLGAGTAVLGGEAGKLSSTLSINAGGSLNEIETVIASGVIGGTVNGGAGALGGAATAEVNSLTRNHRLATIEEITDAALPAALQGAVVGASASMVSAGKADAARAGTHPHDATLHPQIGLAPLVAPEKVITTSFDAGQSAAHNGAAGAADNTAPPALGSTGALDNGTSQSAPQRQQSLDASRGQRAQTAAQDDQTSSKHDSLDRVSDQRRRDSDSGDERATAVADGSRRGRSSRIDFNQISDEQKQIYGRTSMELTGFATPELAAKFSSGLAEVQERWAKTQPDTLQLHRNLDNAMHFSDYLADEELAARHRVLKQYGGERLGPNDQLPGKIQRAMLDVDLDVMERKSRFPDRVTSDGQALIGIAQERLKDLDDYVGRFCAENNLPRPLVELTRDANANFAVGELRMPISLMTGEPELLRQFTFHELDHGAQYAQVMRRIADSMPELDQLSPREAARRLTFETVSRLHPEMKEYAFWEQNAAGPLSLMRRHFKDMTDQQVADMFLSHKVDSWSKYTADVLRLRGGQPLTDAEAASADKLIASFTDSVQPIEEKANLDQSIGDADSLMKRLNGPYGNASVINIIDSLSDTNSVAYKILSPGDDQFLQNAIAWRNAQTTHIPEGQMTQSIRDELMSRVQSRINELESDYRAALRPYQDQLHEQEGWYAASLIPV